MKIFVFIFIELVILGSLVFYFNRRIDQQNFEITQLKEKVYQTQVKGVTDTNEVRLKYYNLERTLRSQEPTKK